MKDLVKVKIYLKPALAGLTVDWGYRHQVQSAIYKTIGAENAELAEELHSLNDIKFFCYSDIMNLGFSRAQNALYTTDKMHFFMSGKRNLVEAMLSGFIHSNSFRVGANHLHITKATEVQVYATEYLNTVSPICVSKPSEEGHEIYIGPTHPEYTDYLARNMSRKLGIEIPSDMFEVVDAGHSKLVEFKNINIKCHTPVIRITDNDLSVIAQYYGLGNRNSIGLGMVKPLPKSQFKKYKI